MGIEPIVVTGTGRCGTSFIARILHERLDVSMGRAFDSDFTNPRGFYEDLSIRSLNQKMIENLTPHREYAYAFRRIVAARSRDPWGFKDPRVLHVFAHMLGHVELDRLIIPKRDKVAVANSMTRCYGWDFEYAMSVVRAREALTRELVINVRPVVIDMNRRWDDEGMEEFLRRELTERGWL
jgi:hypothetical protein